MLKAVEDSIDSLVDEFLQDPCLHRVEHSLHCELYRLLRLKIESPIRLGDLKICPVQKEWPETISRPQKKGRRGNFDLAILGKNDNKLPGPKDFLNGLKERKEIPGYQQYKPIAVIELGLDYSLEHLKADEEKLKNSEVTNGYLVHLHRHTSKENKEQKNKVEDLEKYIENLIKQRSYKIAYAFVQTSEDGGCKKHFCKIGQRTITRNDS